MADVKELSAWTATFVDRDLEDQFQAEVIRRGRGLLLFVVAIALIFVLLLLPTSGTSPGASVVLGITGALLLANIALHMGAPPHLVQRTWIHLWHASILSVIVTILYIAGLRMVTEHRGLAPGTSCVQSIPCLDAYANMRFFVVLNSASLSALPFVGAGAFLAVAVLEGGAFFVAVIAYATDEVVYGIFVLLLLLSLWMTVLVRARSARLEFLLKRHLEGKVVGVKSTDLFSSWLRRSVHKSGPPRPKWMVDPDTIHAGRELGRGANGRVFCAEWHGIQVAVKELIDTSAEAAFAAEIELLAELRHPNVLGFLGVSLDGSQLVLLTEFCEMGSLHDLLSQDLCASLVIRMMAGAAKGMAYLHALDPPIVHQDLKPANLLVTATYECKIADFGLAHLQGRDDTGPMGTLIYMSPETLVDSKSDRASDVYSFGICLWEVAVGESPFRDLVIQTGNVLAAAGDICRRRLRPDASLVPPEYPPPYSEMMEAAWAHNADQRPMFDRIASTLDSLRNLESKDSEAHTSTSMASFGHTHGVRESEGIWLLARVSCPDALWACSPEETEQALLAFTAAVKAALVGESASIAEVRPGMVLARTTRSSALDLALAVEKARRAVEVGVALGSHPVVGDGLPAVSLLHLGAQDECAPLMQDLENEPSMIALSTAFKHGLSTALVGTALSKLETASGHLWRLESGTGDNKLPWVTPPAHTLEIDPGLVREGRMIGTGRTGTTVTRALLRGDAVAIKKFPVGTNLAAAAELLRLAAVQRAIDHEHIVRVLGVTPPHGLVMERCRGSLRGEIARASGRPCDSAVVNDAVRAMAGALVYLHGSGLVHGNLKASNVLVRENGSICVADLAGKELAGATATMTTAAIEVDHIAPEILAGGPASTEGDVYALGVVVHQLHTGKLAVWDGIRGGVLEKISKIVEGTLRVQSGEPVVARCTTRDVRARPAAEEVTSL